MEKLFLAIPCLAAPVVFMLIAPVVVLGILLVLCVLRLRKKEQDAFARQAAAWGFQYYAEDPWGLAKRYENTFDFFKEGSSRKAANILAGQMDGRDVLAFQYSYTTGSGDNQTTWNYSAAILELPIQAPHLRLRGENLFDKVAAWVGHDDINFESAEFSRRYHVACDEPKFAHDFFHPRLIEYLLACGQCPGIETRGTLLVLYDVEQTGVERLVRLVEIGRHLIGSIPDYVRHERPTAAAGPPPA